MILVIIYYTVYCNNPIYFCSISHLTLLHKCLDISLLCLSPMRNITNIENWLIWMNEPTKRNIQRSDSTTQWMHRSYQNDTYYKCMVMVIIYCTVYSNNPDVVFFILRYHRFLGVFPQHNIMNIEKSTLNI